MFQVLGIRPDLGLIFAILYKGEYVFNRACFIRSFFRGILNII